MESSRSMEAKIARLEIQLARAFSAEDVVRINYLQFRDFTVLFGSKTYSDATMELLEDSVVVQSSDGSAVASLSCEKVS